MHAVDRRAIWPRVTLTIGFLGLTGGIYAAVASPATGYEVSIYAGTPVAFWIGSAVALAAAVTVAVAPEGRPQTPLVLFLAGLSIAAIVSLPLLRGYYYFGLYDGLTHLGWAREIAAERLAPESLIYPGGHLVAVGLASITGLELTQAMLLTVTASTVVYLVFVPLVLRTLFEDRLATLVGAFAALLLLPVFNVGTSMHFVAFTLAMFFATSVLFVLCKFVSEPFPSRSITPMDLLLVLTGGVLILFHPQVASDVLVIYTAATATQFALRRVRPMHPIASTRSLLGHTIVLGGLFLFWNSQHSAMFRTVQQLARALFGGGAVGAVVSQQGSSLDGVGASLLELFFKLFLVNAVLTLVAAWVVVGLITSRLDEDLVPSRASRYFGLLVAGGALLAPYAGLHFVGAVSTYFFRHLGFGMVLVTVISAAGVYYLLRSTTRTGPAARGLFAAGTGLALVLSVAVLFASPYIYLPSHHVPEAQLAGYETTFNYEGANVTYTGVRGGAERYSDAVLDAPHRTAETVPADAIRAGLADRVRSDAYFAFTETDVQRELIAYEGLRYDRSTFAAVERQPHVSRVSSTGEYRLYFVDSTGKNGTIPPR